MRSFWSDPYLWIHLAGLATLPIWLELCLLALAVGDPILPVWLELFLVAGIGITPIAWMQWLRPFDIYSLLAVSLKPEQLTEDQRKLLTLFTVPRNRILAIGVAILLAIALQKLYYAAPIAAAITPFAGVGRLGALLIAAIAFLGANLFTQVPVAVLSVLLTRDSTYAATLPFAPDQIRQSFTLLGFPVNRILPPLVADSPPLPTPTPPTTANRQPPIPETAVVAPPDGSSADDLDDIWETDAPPETALSVTTPDTTSPESAEQPDEKPDSVTVAVKAEEVKTEEDLPPAALEESATESTVGTDTLPIVEDLSFDSTTVEDSASDSEAAWLDAPAIADPASGEPPNSL